MHIFICCVYWVFQLFFTINKDLFGLVLYALKVLQIILLKKYGKTCFYCVELQWGDSVWVTVPICSFLLPEDSWLPLASCETSRLLHVLFSYIAPIGLHAHFVRAGRLKVCLISDLTHFNTVVLLASLGNNYKSFGLQLMCENTNKDCCQRGRQKTLTSSYT